MKRPAGLTLVGVVAAILGVAQIVVSLGYFDISGVSFLQTLWLQGDVGAVAVNFARAAGIALFALGVMGIVFAFGAIRLKGWAWPLGVTTYLVGIAGSILMLFVTTLSVTPAVTGIVSAIIAWYLSTEDVQLAFGGETTASGGHRPHVV